MDNMSVPAAMAIGAKENLRAQRALRALRRFEAVKPGRGVTLAADHIAVREGTSRFRSTVVHASLVDRILKSGHNSRKIGKVVQKGRWRGFPIFTLTLEERRTCPAECPLWLGCYGNNMHWAQRIIADDVFEQRLWGELARLQQRFEAGFAVRLHVLGDFYSVEYAQLWSAALDAFPALHVFGFTARSPDDAIGEELLGLTIDRWDRFALRFSGAVLDRRTAIVVGADEAPPAGTVKCPAQTGATACCATCAFCWQSDRPVAFVRH